MRKDSWTQTGKYSAWSSSSPAVSARSILRPKDIRKCCEIVMCHVRCDRTMNQWEAASVGFSFIRFSEVAAQTQTAHTLVRLCLVIFLYKFHSHYVFFFSLQMTTIYIKKKSMWLFLVSVHFPWSIIRISVAGLKLIPANVRWKAGSADLQRQTETSHQLTY